MACIAANLAARWRITVGLLDADPVDSLEILDCASAGLWAIQLCPAEVAAEELGATEVVSLTPTTPTAVWAWLSRLAGPVLPNPLSPGPGAGGPGPR
jgi:hypothetical protein